MECIVREVCKLINARPVIVLLVRPLAKLAAVGVREGQNARAASMQPVSRVALGVASKKTSGDGFGCAFVV